MIGSTIRSVILGVILAAGIILCSQLPALENEVEELGFGFAILFHGSVSVNCKSSVRCMGEKLSSEISVKTTSPDGVW